jgi:murein DD-endopeptidase MepM/ murein hydrolase activator NlpD
MEKNVEWLALAAMKAGDVDFGSVAFGPVIRFPVGTKLLVLDLSGKEASSFHTAPFTVGRYLERRGIYTSSLFGEGTKRRCIHLGIDLGAPVGTPVHAPMDGTVAFCGYNPGEGDYGHCLITKHAISGRDVWFLFGHLGRDVLQRSGQQGQPVVTGAVLGHLGSPEENGGWPPHLHFQISLVAPTTHDLPGVCSEDTLEQSMCDFPDPRLVLGPMY